MKNIVLRQGPGAHAHEKEDCIFYVIVGTMSILAPAGVRP